MSARLLPEVTRFARTPAERERIHAAHAVHVAAQALGDAIAASPDHRALARQLASFAGGHASGAAVLSAILLQLEHVAEREERVAERFRASAHARLTRGGRGAS